MKIFKAFTLSELMVALAVLGVIAAVVTPSIMKTRPNKNKMMIKKSFYTTEQIVSSLINDESLYPDMREVCTTGEANEGEVYCAWGFDYTTAANYEGTSYSGDTKFADLFKAKLNIKSVDPTNNLIFYTTDGIKWDLSGTSGAWTHAANSKVGTFDDQTGAVGKGVIEIDVNGAETPNVACSADTKCDQYKIEILSNGKMRIDPTYAKAVEYATINTSVKDN